MVYYVKKLSILHRTMYKNGIGTKYPADKISMVKITNL